MTGLLRGLGRLVWVSIAVVFLPSLGIAELAVDEALARLESASAAHPEDPDLAWALTRKLAEAGEGSRAVRATRRFLGRWPDRRSDARTTVALALIDTRQPNHALALLNDEVTDRPRSGIAHFYRALAYRASGQRAAADSGFQLAARLEPSLRVESLLARALGLFESGMEEEAIGLLKEILLTDPTSETAVRARVMLREREIPDLRNPWRADGYVGFEWDDNVTLAGNENETVATGKDDVRGIWGLGGSWQPALTDEASATLGYRFDQSVHHDLGEFDLLSNTVFASVNWRPHKRFAFRFDAIAFNTLQDLDNQLTGGTFRPNFIFVFGRKWGALRLFGQLDVLEYEDPPFLEAWERDALTFSAGVEHILPLPAEGSSLIVSAAWSRTLTQSGTSGGADGFDGDFDYDGYRVRGRARLRLPWQLMLLIETSYTHDRYHNDNFSSAFALEGIRKRRDDILSGRVAISREIVPHVAFETYWRGTRRISNVDLFDYDKQLVGMLFRFTTD